MTALRFSVWISFVLALFLLTLEVFHARSFGRRPLFSQSAGNHCRGILYAFGQSLLPGEKESASLHLPTYIAGIIYHAGIFAAILVSLALAAQIQLPSPVLPFLQASMAAAIIAGIGLFLKRVFKPSLRFISCVDDFLANILVDIFLLLGLLSTWFRAVLPFFFLTAIVTFFFSSVFSRPGSGRSCLFSSSRQS